MSKIAIIGSGFAGLSAAAILAQAGHQVDVYEKHQQLGGRARQFEAQGFKFDMGPSWYWMPEIFEQFYRKFGKKASDFYELVRLEPSYEVIFEGETIKVPSKLEDLYKLFEEIEPGSASKLKAFLDEAKYKYQAGMNTYVWKPGHSWFEYLDKEVISSFFKLQMLSSVSSQVRKLFSDPRLIKILEFPVLFLGAKPSNTPALYTLMNYADMGLGTWYPIGGMHEIIKAFVSICKDQGVKFHTNKEVKTIHTQNDVASSIEFADGKSAALDYIISGADYHHTEQDLLSSTARNYSESYWQNRKMAPSSLLFYLGLNKRIPNLKHHTLFFDADFDIHADEIYNSHEWPSDPLFYVCCPSQTDDTIAPEGFENMFLLMPISTELEDSQEKQEEYYQRMLSRLNKHVGFDINSNVVYKRAFSIDDFKSEYHSFKGNAYGLANTLYQTGPLKPKLRNKRITNLVYAGQLTVPGPGVPPSIISGQLAANEILSNL